MKLKHIKCGYEWEYKGTNPWVATCPRCLGKVFIKKEHTLYDENL